MSRRAVLVAAVALVLCFTVGVTEAAKKKKDDGMAAGKVKSIDAAAGSLVLEGKKGKDGNPTPDSLFKVNKDTKVTVNGEAKALADITVGTNVSIKLAADKVTAESVRVGEGKPKTKQ